MGINDVNLIGPAQSTISDYPRLEPLFKVIKTTKDGCYAAVRYAYLREYNYYVVETRHFKVSIKREKTPQFFQYLENHKTKEEAFWICVRGLSYYLISSGLSCNWGSAETDKAIQFWAEAEVGDRPLPTSENIQEELSF